MTADYRQPQYSGNGNPRRGRRGVGEEESTGSKPFHASESPESGGN